MLYTSTGGAKTYSATRRSCSRKFWGLEGLIILSLRSSGYADLSLVCFGQVRARYCSSRLYRVGYIRVETSRIYLFLIISASCGHETRTSIFTSIRFSHLAVTYYLSPNAQQSDPSTPYRQPIHGPYPFFSCPNSPDQVPYRPLPLSSSYHQHLQEFRYHRFRIFTDFQILLLSLSMLVVYATNQSIR